MEERLKPDLGDDQGDMALMAKSDPVLAHEDAGVKS
jgi:hypothetical protein